MTPDTAERPQMAVEDFEELVRRAPRGHGNWSEADGALMAVEITSHDRDTNQGDRIDRDNNTITVYSEPKDGRCQQSAAYPWGATVEIPPP